MKKTVVGLLFAAVAVAASADVNVDSLLGEAAMWLDASSPANFEFNGRGGVEKWLNKGSGKATYGDAVAYKVRNQTSGDCSSSVIYGGVQLVDGAPAFQMGASGSDVDLRYERISTIRTVFLVGRFILDDNLEPLLGDDTYFDLHRGKSAGRKSFGILKPGRDDKPSFFVHVAILKGFIIYYRQKAVGKQRVFRTRLRPGRFPAACAAAARRQGRPHRR